MGIVTLFRASFLLFTVHSIKLHDMSSNYLNKTTEIHAKNAQVSLVMREPNERANKRRAKAKM